MSSTSTVPIVLRKIILIQGELTPHELTCFSSPILLNFTLHHTVCNYGSLLWKASLSISVALQIWTASLFLCLYGIKNKFHSLNETWTRMSSAWIFPRGKKFRPQEVAFTTGLRFKRLEMFIFASQTALMRKIAGISL